MKRLNALLAVAIIGMAMPALASPYNTIQVNGTWDAGEWDQANETVASNTNPGWDVNGNLQSLLVTWDAVNLYVGLRGNSWSNATLIYIDSSSLTTGQENADYFQGFTTQPFFDPDFVGGHFNMEWGDGAVPTDIRSISAVDGTTSSLLGLAAIAVHDQNHDGGLGEGLTEIAIPWALIGLEPNGSISVAAGVGWAVNTGPVIPAGGLGGFSGDELGGADQVGGTDEDSSTLDGPVTVIYDADGDGVPDQLSDTVPPNLIKVCTLEDDQTMIEATFDEPVDAISAEDEDNWDFDGGLSIEGAIQQSDPAKIILYLNGYASAGQDYTVTASNISDLNENVATSTTSNFCTARLFIQANMKFRLLEETGEVQDVAVEGSLAPLTWDPTCDDLLYDDGTHGDAVAGDSTYTGTLIFCMSHETGELPEQELNYKFTYGCTEWEDIDNHVFTMDCDTGTVFLDIWWEDHNPDNFTTHPIDVIFTVEAPGLMDLGIDGSVLPLTWDFPSVTPLSDDAYPDGIPGDDIYGTVVQFPENSLKSVLFKYTTAEAFECSTQADRSVYLNDEEFDVIGGELGPIVMPLAYFDHCSTIWRDLEVVFSVSFAEEEVPPAAEDTVAVNGSPSGDPNVFNWDIPSLNEMFDDGVAPDENSGDLVYTKAIVFPEYSNFGIAYKYLVNSDYECPEQGDRFLWLDPTNFDAAGNPQILELDFYHLCHPVAVDEIVPADRIAKLDANWPNPFNPKTSLRFFLKEDARVRLEIYDIAGRRIRALIDAEAQAGEHLVQWTGVDDNGRLVPSGIYFAKLTAASEVQTQKLTLLK
jgi:hypothetical protein